jgi:hypothetical protein
MTPSRRLSRPIAAGLALLVPASSLWACAEPDHDPKPYLRVQDDETNGGVRLQIALRTFVRDADEPTLTLVGVAHVGDQAYYDALAERLDAHDLVLFEGVGPIWARMDPEATQEDQIAATKSRLRTLGITAEQRRRAGKPVRTIDDLIDGRSGYEARLIRAASTDAWGNPFLLTRGKLGLSIESLGADGARGGTKANADISLADLPPLAELELDEGDGIQSQLAGAAGLVFQLSAMDYDKPHWVNSDTTAEALSYALAGLDPDDARPGGGAPATGGGDPLFDLLSGRGMLGKIAGGVLKFIGASPQSRAMLRLMLIETLANADEMMDLAGGMGEEGMGGGISHMMEVLIDQRNEVVLGDIRGAIRDAKETGEPETIAIFYGAGHLAEMERSLVGMGFAPTETVWLDAIGVDPDDSGMNREQLAGMRTMMGRMIETQTRALRDMQSQD